MRILKLMVVTGLISLLCMQAYAEDPQRSRLVVPAPEFNFGEVSEGEQVEHHFILKNEGNAPLQIERVVPSCGCTASSVDSETIQPGTEGKVQVSFDTKGFFGEKLKTVRVYTNDSEVPMTVLTIKGVIKPDVEIVPSRISFNDVVKGVASPEELLTLKVREGAQATLDKVFTYSQHLQLETVRDTPREKQYRVSILPEAPLGEFRERIVVGVKGGKVSSMNIPVFAVVRGKLRLRPARLSFGILEGTETIERTVKLVNRGDTPIRIVEIKNSSDAVSVSHKEDKPGKQFSITVSVKPNAVKEDLSLGLTIVTDSEEESTLTLNIYGILPS